MENEDNLVLTEPYEQYRPYIPEGSYYAKCIGHNWSTLVVQGNRGPIHKRKLFLRFELLEVPDTNEPAKNVELFASFNMRWDNQVPPGSRYFKAWAKAHGKQPSRNAVLSPRIFRGKTFIVKIRTVKPLDGGEEMPSWCHYSIVDSIHIPDKDNPDVSHSHS